MVPFFCLHHQSFKFLEGWIFHVFSYKKLLYIQCVQEPKCQINQSMAAYKLSKKVKMKIAKILNSIEYCMYNVNQQAVGYSFETQHITNFIYRTSLFHLLSHLLYYKDTNRKIRKCSVHRLYAIFFSSIDVYTPQFN